MLLEVLSWIYFGQNMTCDSFFFCKRKFDKSMIEFFLVCGKENVAFCLLNVFARIFKAKKFAYMYIVNNFEL